MQLPLAAEWQGGSQTQCNQRRPQASLPAAGPRRDRVGAPSFPICVRYQRAEWREQFPTQTHPSSGPGGLVWAQGARPSCSWARPAVQSLLPLTDVCLKCAVRLCRWPLAAASCFTKQVLWQSTAVGTHLSCPPRRSGPGFPGGGVREGNSRHTEMSGMDIWRPVERSSTSGLAFLLLEKRSHEATLFTPTWQASFPSLIPLVLLPPHSAGLLSSLCV